MILPESKELDAFHPPSPSDAKIPLEPPPYTTVALAQTSLLPAAGDSAFFPPAKPTNFVCLSRKSSSIRDQFVIDPSLRVPDAILPPLAKDETRPHLKLESQHASVNADAWLVAPSVPMTADGRPVRATVVANSEHGSVTLRIHTPSSGRAPMRISATAPHGSITLHIPRSFRGPISAETKHGSVTFSSGLKQHMTIISDVDHRLRAFVGDLQESSWAAAPDAWEGDELVLNSEHSSIRIQYIDDPNALQTTQSLGTKVSKWLFGWANPMANAGATAAGRPRTPPGGTSRRASPPVSGTTNARPGAAHNTFSADGDSAFL